ncbi:Copper-resistance protein [Trema orientale]|uniref:Copper-resistance protein n=1 Tax=Trema orientale TaxID=63057 RepID=A0A2P5CP67_TREOI|nr:Copper-resistance protein [Trema orientale]
MEVLPWVRVLIMAACLFPASVECMVRHYKFDVVLKNSTKLCSSKPIVTVSGRFPGPTIYAREDDTVLVKVVNHVKYNLSIHWHGIRQLRTGWADGPAYITQCPIQPGQQYIYNFTLTGQRGTLWWHAHILWLRATVHGAIVILPKRGVPYPFPTPHEEMVIVLGEWWKSDVEAVINEALKSGLAPNVSDAHTINGQPGPVSTCSSQGGSTLPVEAGKTYLLRIINAALNEELFFKIAGHQVTVVEDTGMITPENHPIHLHGFNFFEVGRGLGNFNPKRDSKNFNLVDPVERNTVGVPSGGWTAIRFRADNPGVWFMHCHLEVHTTWGLKTAFVVDNGKGPNESVLPPPNDLPKC